MSFMNCLAFLQDLEESGTYQPEEVSPIHHPFSFLHQSTRGFWCLAGAPACSHEHETWLNDRFCAKPVRGTTHAHAPTPHTLAVALAVWTQRYVLQWLADRQVHRQPAA